MRDQTFEYETYTPALKISPQKCLLAHLPKHIYVNTLGPKGKEKNKLL